LEIPEHYSNFNKTKVCEFVKKIEQNDYVPDQTELSSANDGSECHTDDDDDDEHSIKDDEQEEQEEQEQDRVLHLQMEQRIQRQEQLEKQVLQQQQQQQQQQQEEEQEKMQQVLQQQQQQQEEKIPLSNQRSDVGHRVLAMRLSEPKSDTQPLAERVDVLQTSPRRLRRLDSPPVGGGRTIHLSGGSQERTIDDDFQQSQEEMSSELKAPQQEKQVKEVDDEESDLEKIEKEEMLQMREKMLQLLQQQKQRRFLVLEKKERLYQERNAEMTKTVYKLLSETVVLKKKIWEQLTNNTASLVHCLLVAHKPEAAKKVVMDFEMVEHDNVQESVNTLYQLLQEDQNQKQSNDNNSNDSILQGNGKRSSLEMLLLHQEKEEGEEQKDDDHHYENGELSQKRQKKNVENGK